MPQRAPHRRLGQRECYYGISELAAESAVSACRNDHVLFSVTADLIGHRGSVAASRQLCLPQLLAGVGVEGYVAGVIGPSDLQLLHILLVDLIERRVPLTAGIASVVGPFRNRRRLCRRNPRAASTEKRYGEDCDALNDTEVKGYNLRTPNVQDAPIFPRFPATYHPRIWRHSLREIA